MAGLYLLRLNYNSIKVIFFNVYYELFFYCILAARQVN